MLTYSEVRKRCLKPDESDKPFYARHITHAISCPVVWLLSGTSVTPNMITLASLIAGLMGCLCFIFLTAKSLFIGALLIELYYVLDAVDGQFARLKEVHNKTGAFFDAMVDRLIHLMIYFSLSIGIFMNTGDIIPVILGFTASVSTLWIALIWHCRSSVFLYFIQKSTTIRVNPVTAAKSERDNTSLYRTIFSVLQKTVSFPMAMNILTVLSLIALMFSIMDHRSLYITGVKGYILYSAATGLLVALVLTVQWITTQKIDSDYETLFPG